MIETDWSDVGVIDLPTGTVTLLLADVEGSTRLWETQPDVMTDAVARLDATIADLIATHHGVRPVEQGEGDSFVIAFARAADAVACALDLQSASPPPIKLRIGIHTGDVQLRDEGNYVGPTINRTARLRDLGHGGQTLMSGATELLVVDQLPLDASLTDLGTHPLRDLPRPERVSQLGHPDLPNDFPPLRATITATTHNLPVQLTSFVGRHSETNSVHEALAANRLVTLTGAGGAGKTRLAVHAAAALAAKFADGVCYVDLAPITVPEVVPVTVARSMGLPDQSGLSTMDTLLRFVRDRRTLVVLDNCEHLLDASATMASALLSAAPELRLLATSREPIGVTGEATWQVPSLSLEGDALELFAERARLAQADFAVTEDNRALVVEICHRLDGMPLAIELAAARVRALSLNEILDGLHDRFRLLTGGSRTSVRRQQTLRASVDWSHALLTETEQILFRRLAVFLGGFDLDAAQSVAGAGDIERYQVLDQLTLLVDKSLVIAERTDGRTRYRLLETVRQYALEQLGMSGEADVVRSRHCAYYTSMAAALDAPGSNYEQRVGRADLDIDNLRSAFGWSLETSDIENAVALASFLYPLWHARGRIREGRGWFSAVLANGTADTMDLPPAVRSRALADDAMLSAAVGDFASIDQAELALGIARELGDPALVLRALTACCCIAAYDPTASPPYFAEAISLARKLDDRWRLSQVLYRHGISAHFLGDHSRAREAAEEGRDLADEIGDGFVSRQCRVWLSSAQMMKGELDDAIALLDEVVAEAEAAHDALNRVSALLMQGAMLAHRGDTDAEREAANAALDDASTLGGFLAAAATWELVRTGLASGDVAAATRASEAASELISAQSGIPAIYLGVLAEAALARGDVDTAEGLADHALTSVTGWHLQPAHAIRARVAIAKSEPSLADDHVARGLAIAADGAGHLFTPDLLEICAELAANTDALRAARLCGAAKAGRQRMGVVRFKVYDADYEASLATARDTLGLSDFDVAWAEGAAMSTEEAITYTQRGRGERKRPSTGWASLTPTELDVVRLVAEGLTNKDVATRLFISPRTVQSHLAHVFAKLGFNTRTQLAQEATKRAAAEAS